MWNVSKVDTLHDNVGLPHLPTKMATTGEHSFTYGKFMKKFTSLETILAQLESNFDGMIPS